MFLPANMEIFYAVQRNDPPPNNYQLLLFYFQIYETNNRMIINCNKRSRGDPSNPHHAAMKKDGIIGSRNKNFGWNLILP